MPQTPQPIFNHPELVIQTIPQKKWFACNAGSSPDGDKTFVFYDTHGVSNVWRTVILDRNSNKLEERFCTDPSFTKLFAKITYGSGEDRPLEEFFFEDGKTISYQRINGANTLSENWFDKDGEEIAWRYTENGVLTRGSLEEPAVSINRPHNLRREEYWNDGVLQKVCLVDRKTGKKIMKQFWVDDKCMSQKVHPTRRNEILEKDLALPEAPTYEKEIEIPKPVFNLVSAQQAREEFEDDDEKIQKVLAKFETMRQEALIRGIREVQLRIDPRIKSRIANLFHKAGYSVLEMEVFLSVSY